MFNWILRNVIGGTTGKRELCLCLLFIWLALSIYLVVREMLAASVETSWSMWTILTPFVFAITSGAFTLDWHAKQHKGNGE